MKIRAITCSWAILSRTFYVNNEEEKEWIEEIVKQEFDFRSYREFYYCPNCDKLLAEFQR